jgi:hypothetical protein
MADTQRTQAALLALLADNITGDISPQDIRDFLVSVSGGYGSIFVHGGVTAQTGITSTPVKMSGFATNGISSGTVPDNTTDDITISVAGDYLVSGSISFTGSSNSTFDIDIYINSTTTNYGFERKLGTGTDVGSGPLAGLITCAENDKIDIFVSSPDGGTSITPTQASLIVTRVS